ncbi:MAG: 50S ribosomal protein L10 [Methanobacteriota archaeon]|nr:MAG: 50S ribosomal protein L10 [Euryarchaeota archaeon]
MAHVAPVKKRLVEDLASRCAQAQVVGIVNIHGIPAPQFQSIRKKLWGRATITVAKNNLLRLALEQASSKKPDLVKLGETGRNPGGDRARQGRHPPGQADGESRAANPAGCRATARAA